MTGPTDTAQVKKTLLQLLAPDEDEPSGLEVWNRGLVTKVVLRGLDGAIFGIVFRGLAG